MYLTFTETTRYGKDVSRPDLTDLLVDHLAETNTSPGWSSELGRATLDQMTDPEFAAYTEQALQSPSFSRALWELVAYQRDGDVANEQWHVQP